MTLAGFRLRALALTWTCGEEKPKPDKPKVWFTSTESFAKVLSAGNCERLRIIAEQAPGSVAELSDIPAGPSPTCRGP